MAKTTAASARAKRKIRGRKKIFGSSLRPRLCITKSNRHFFVQAIDDNKSITLFSASTYKLNVENDKKIDALVADIYEKANKSKIEKFVFDRSGNQYAGNIKKIADGLRDKGIQI